MKIYYLPKSTQKPIEKLFLPQNSIVCTGAEYFDELSLDDELRGDSHVIKSLCKISMEQNILFLCPAFLFCKNKKFFGTIIVDNGKFLGISDATHSITNTYNESNALRVFDTSKGRFGVVSGEDIYFFEVSRLMKLWECDALFFATASSPTQNEKILAKAQGLMNQTTSIIFGSTKIMGYMCSQNRKDNILDIKTISKSDYIQKRKKQMYRDIILR